MGNADIHHTDLICNLDWIFSDIIISTSLKIIINKDICHDVNFIYLITLFSLLSLYFVNHLLLHNMLLWHDTAIAKNIY